MNLGEQQASIDTPNSLMEVLFEKSNRQKTLGDR